MVLTPLNDASQLRAEEFVKRWCEYRLELVVVVFVHNHLDAFEENLIELAANVLGCSSVSTGALFGQVDRHLDEPGGIAEVCSEVFEFAVDPGEFGVEALLFGAEHFDGDRVVVVRLEKFALSALDLKLLRGKGLRLNCGVVLEELELLGQRASQGLSVLRFERQPVVHFLNEVLGEVKVDRPQRTVGALGMSAEAGVVRVFLSAARLRDLNDHAHLAVPAEQCRFKVVAVLIGALAIDLALQDLLHLLECLLIDERLMVSGVLRAFVADDAEVIRVGENLVHLSGLDWLRWELCGLGHHEAALDEFVGEGAHTPVPACVGVECPGDEGRPFGVDFDGADLTAIGDIAHVEIPYGRTSDAAT